MQATAIAEAIKAREVLKQAHQRCILAARAAGADNSKEAEYALKAAQDEVAVCLDVALEAWADCGRALTK